MNAENREDVEMHPRGRTLRELLDAYRAGRFTPSLWNWVIHSDTYYSTTSLYLMGEGAEQVACQFDAPIGAETESRWEKICEGFGVKPLRGLG